MEARKDQPGGSASGRPSRLRYPLRSASKSKDEKPGVAEVPASASSRWGRKTSTVSKSVSVLELSSEEKSAKPSRRLSIPPKPSLTPVGRLARDITPISETRLKKKTTSDQDKSETPKSDLSISGSRKKFSVLSSVSYWVTQIKLSELAGKHSISLGFFKLALESGCEPLQRLREELKSYVRRYNLLELGESTKELLKSYDIGEDLSPIQVSEACSQGPEPSDEDSLVLSSSGVGNLKPKSLKTGSVPASTGSTRVQKEALRGRIADKSRASITRSSSNLNSSKDNSQTAPKKRQKPSSAQDKEEVKKQLEKQTPVTEDATDLLPNEESQQDEDKENVDVLDIQEIREVVEA